ncbi:MAG: hypothetical protein WDW38_008511 [Sanguina aurantia]
MDREKLLKLMGASKAEQTGGKGTMRRKKKAVHKTTTTDDKRLQNTLKRLGVNTIPGIEEVNIFKDDTAIHFVNPKVQASIAANTFVISGPSTTKKVQELMPGILNQMGPDSLSNLKKMMSQHTLTSAGPGRHSGGHVQQPAAADFVLPDSLGATADQSPRCYPGALARMGSSAPPSVSQQPRQPPRSPPSPGHAAALNLNSAQQLQPARCSSQLTVGRTGARCIPYATHWGNTNMSSFQPTAVKLPRPARCPACVEALALRPQPNSVHIASTSAAETCTLVQCLSGACVRPGELGNMPGGMPANAASMLASMGQYPGAAEGDDDVPDLVSNFEEASK